MLKENGIYMNSIKYIKAVSVVIDDIVAAHNT